LYMPQHGVDNHCNCLTNGIVSHAHASRLDPT
jgi:hypothetical protein